MLDIISDMLKNDLVSGSSGNVSMRIDDHVMITPSSVRYNVM
ncbi:MAG: class II aldolase/adducin family protein, partial [Candidatus Thorarchaeota archaeon]